LKEDFFGGDKGNADAAHLGDGKKGELKRSLQEEKKRDRPFVG